MNIWVKEMADYLSAMSIEQISRKEVTVERFIKSKSVLESGDIVVVSKKDKDVVNNSFFPAHCMFYEDIIEKISKEVINEFTYRYDYYYLLMQMEKAKSDKVDTLITGSSYGLWDVDESKLENAVNLSLGSQDIYYSIKVLQSVLKENKNIKHIIFLCALYYFYSDLSLQKDVNALIKISKVYQPVFNDTHNAVFVPPRQEFISYSDYFDEQRVLEAYCNLRKDNPYFNSEHPREKRWELFSMEEREENAINRTKEHNKNVKYINSLISNKRLFSKFSADCTNMGIELSVVIIPTSYQYRKYLDSSFRNTFYSSLNEAEGIIHLYDLSDLNLFSQDDYFDADHLNEVGASKFTDLIIDEVL